jgi:hypothetical protein
MADQLLDEPLNLTLYNFSAHPKEPNASLMVVGSRIREDNPTT